MDESLAGTYRSYIACLNRHDLDDLGRFVHDDVHHNGRALGLSGYKAMIDAPYVASRLDFDCTPQGAFLGIPVNGQRVQFSENVIYAFRDGKICRVWSVIDKAAIEAQLSG
jgi:predicted ester cyclase